MTMSKPSSDLYKETRSILNEDNPNARWENNSDGFPVPDLGRGSDGQERDRFTERDVEILASNPISLVGMDAAFKDIISLHQAMYVGYKPLPRLPEGLTRLALNGAFREIGKRILSAKSRSRRNQRKNTHGHMNLSTPACSRSERAIRKTGPSMISKNDGLISIEKPWPSTKTLHRRAFTPC